MEMTILEHQGAGGLIELDASEINYISGGALPAAAVAAAALVTLGKSALEFGRSLGGSVYRILH